MDHRGGIVHRALALCIALSACWCGSARAQPAASQPDGEPVLLFPIVQDGKWGYMDRAGKVVIRPQYEAAGDFSEGLACVTVAGWRGFIDRTGAMVIKPTFGWAGPFHEGFAPVFDTPGTFAGRPQFFRGGRFCSIDRAGKVQRFDCSRAGFREGLTVVNKDVCYDTAGKKVEHDADELKLFSDGLAAACKDGLWGYLDHKMAWAVRPQFNAADEFAEELAAVARADRPPPADRSAYWKWLKEVKFTWGYCDKSGKVAIDYQFEDAWPFADGLAPVRVNGQWGYADRSGATVIRPQFDYAWPFAEGLGRVLVGEKQGFIDRTGRIVIEPRFAPAWEFAHGLARVGRDGKEGYIGRDGRFVWEPTQ